MNNCGFLLLARDTCNRSPINSRVKGGRTMKQIKYVSLILIFLHLATGCSGNYGNFKRKTGSESNATKRELIDNWSDYDIWLHYQSGNKASRLTIIIFDTKNDDKKILVEGRWSKVKDQETWKEIVKENTASDGEFTLVWDNYGPYYSTGVQEISGPDNQLYGFIIYQESAVSLVRVELIDENTLRFSWRPPRPVGGR
jgi:hypothetical protein